MFRIEVGSCMREIFDAGRTQSGSASREAYIWATPKVVDAATKGLLSNWVATTFPDEMATLSKVGVNLASSPVPNIFAPSLTSPGRPNLFLHGALAARIAVEICQGLVKSGAIDADAALELSKDCGAMNLFEVGVKRANLMRREAIEAGFSPGDDPEIALIKLAESVDATTTLEKREIELMTTAQRMIDSFVVMEALIDTSGTSPTLREGDLTRMIVHIADILSATSLPSENIWAAVVTPSDKIIIADWRKAYAESEQVDMISVDGKVSGWERSQGDIPKNAVKLLPFLDTQCKLDEAICEELAEKVGIEPPTVAGFIDWVRVQVQFETPHGTVLNTSSGV